MPQSKQLSRSQFDLGNPTGQTLTQNFLKIFIDHADRDLLCESSEAPSKMLPGSKADNTPFGVVVIDVSGSMNNRDWPPSRLEAAKAAAIAYVQRLAQQSPDAVVAVVTFGSKAKVVCDPARVGDTPRILDAIDLLRPGGGTNMAGALKIANRLLDAKRMASAQVILLTDGHSTSFTNPDGFGDQIRKIATLETVGIGGDPTDVDEGLLRRISSRHPDGSPRYRWIGDREQLVEHFQELAVRITR